MSCPKLHYTPNEVAIELLKDIDFKENDITLEPCKASGSFYNNIPYEKDWCEIEQGRDLFKYDFGDKRFTKCITNPPYRSNENNVKDRKNILWDFIAKCFEVTDEECWFLLSYRHLNTFTPKRLRMLKEMGFNLCFMRILNIKIWSGRYYWICFSKNKEAIVNF